MTANSGRSTLRSDSHEADARNLREIENLKALNSGLRLGLIGVARL
jgi:hypothetical protein